MDTITKKVEDMYSQFPFPSHQGPMSTLSWFYDLDLLLASVGSHKAIDKIRVLDAGCGTGEEVVCCASVFPQAHFTAVELNSTSLGIAKKNAKYLEVENIDFHKNNIMDITNELGSFDVIISSGVIHHLSNPEEGLKRLVNLLEPDGVLAIYLYCEYTRDRNIRIKQAVNMVEGDQGLVDKRIKIARALSNKYEWTDIKAVDAFLHVNEHLYTAKSIFDMLRECGLKFLRFRDEPIWDASILIKDTDVVRMLRNLPNDLHYEVLDLAFSEQRNRNAYEFFTCHDSYVSHPVKEIGKDKLEFYPMRAPHVQIEKEVSDNGLFNANILHDNKQTVQLKLSNQAVDIIMKCDGQKSLGKILEETTGGPENNPAHQEMEGQIFQLLNLALKRDLIYIRPVPSGKVWDKYKMVDFTKAS